MDQNQETRQEVAEKTREKIEILGQRSNLLGEFWLFIKNEKKWWLTPIVLVFIFLTFLILVGNTPLGPFIYPLF